MRPNAEVLRALVATIPGTILFLFACSAVNGPAGPVYALLAGALAAITMRVMQAADPLLRHYTPWLASPFRCPYTENAAPQPETPAPAESAEVNPDTAQDDSA